MKKLSRWIATACFLAVSLVACGQNAVFVDREVREHVEADAAARAAKTSTLIATDDVRLDPTVASGS